MTQTDQNDLDDYDKSIFEFSKGNDGQKHTVATFKLTLGEQLIFII